VIDLAEKMCEYVPSGIDGPFRPEIPGPQQNPIDDTIEASLSGTLNLILRALKVILEAHYGEPGG
jgi:hypothetical protein